MHPGILATVSLLALGGNLGFLNYNMTDRFYLFFENFFFFYTPMTQIHVNFPFEPCVCKLWLA